MAEGGKKVWYFADGYLPEPQKSDKMESHKALMIFTPSSTPFVCHFGRPETTQEAMACHAGMGYAE